MAEKETLDFSQVKEGSNFSPKHKTEGEYLGTITSFTDTKSKSGNKMWVFGVQLKTDRRAVYPVYCLLGADQVWKLRNMMMAAGFKVPKKRMSVDGNRLVGKDIGIFLEDDEYEGKMKSVIGSFFPADEYTGPDAGSSTDSDEEDEEEELPEEDEEYEDEDASEGDEDDTDDEADDEEDEEEPEPAPAKKAPAKKSAPARAKVKKAPEPEPEDDEDEDEMDVEEV